MDIPTTKHVREALETTYVESLDENFAEGWFDVWLAKERADAVREAAQEFHEMTGFKNIEHPAVQWLKTKADQIEEQS